MAKDKNLQNQDDLTEADKAVLRLYEDTKTPIEWDESDDAVLSFARSIHEPAEENEPGEAPEIEDSTVVPLVQPQAKPVALVFRSPLAGLAIAASLLIGVVVGQGVLPYFNLGVSPDYAKILEDNERLAQQIARYGNLQGAENYFQVLEKNTTLQAEIENLRRIDTTLGAEAIGTPLEGATSLSELSDLFGSFDCAALTARTAPDSRVIVEGYVATREDLTRLQGALGEDGGLVSRAEVAGAPFCSALEVLHSYTEVAGGLRGGPSVRPYNHRLDYRQGESLVLAATAASHFEGYLYVDLVLPDGRVRHLQPGAGQQITVVPAGRELILGAEDGGHTISPPFGQLLAIVISTPQPLFEGPRPNIEAAGPYFVELSAALQSLGQEAALIGPLSSYGFITTRASD